MLCNLPPPADSDHLVRLAWATITSGQKASKNKKPAKTEKFGLTLKRLIHLDHFCFRDIYLEEEIDLLRFVIKYGNEKSHNLFDLMMQTLQQNTD